MATGESGFGSPTLVPPAEYPDAGFGDPFDAAFNALARDTGFGSAYDPLAAALSVPVAEVSMQGGSRLDIYGPFLRGQVYAVQLTDGVNTYDCFNGVSRSGLSLARRHGILTTYTPALPQGSYDLLLLSEGVVLAALQDAIAALPGIHTPETYTLRQFFPPHLAAGSRVGFTDNKQPGALSGLLDSLGALFNDLSGRACTYITAGWSYGDSTLAVRSTLSFPSAGKLACGDLLFSYTGKTENSFTGIAPLRVNESEVLQGKEVTFYDK